MSEAPSWLTEENISTATKVTQNPAAQKAAKSAAKNPAVQKAVKKEVTKAVSSPPVAESAPNWADNSDTYNAPASDVETGSRQNSSAQSSEFIIEEGTLKSMQQWHLALRCLYMATAILMATAAVLALMATPSLGVLFFCFYVLFFSVVICCFEFALQVCCLLNP
jgi:Tfp pilus assembly protein PilX